MESNKKVPMPRVISPEPSVTVDSCRVCMAHRMKTSAAFEEIFDNSICDKLQFCTGLQVLKSDRLPVHICTSCLIDLHSAFKFKTTCLESDQTYRKLLRRVKKEAAEDYSDSEMPIQDSLEEVHDIKIEDSKVSVQVEMLAAALEQTDSVKRTRKRTQKVEDSPAQDVKLPAARKRRKGAKPAPGDPPKPTPGVGDPPKPAPGVGDAPKPAKYRRLFCELCQIKFATKDQSDEHKRVVHKEMGKSWICEMCGKMFQHQSSHLSHARCHRPPSFACAQCDYVTWHKHDLKKHLQRHTGFKPYQCEFCTAAYFCSSNLKSHIERVHHQIKRFKCPVCHKEFFERHKLERHLDSHNDVKRFSCQLCQSQFSRGAYWRQHMAKRHGVEPPRPRPGRRRTVFSMGQDAIADAAETPGAAEKLPS